MQDHKSTDREQKREAIRAIRRQQLIEYLSNPDNEPLARCHLAVRVLKYKRHSSLYGLFTPSELSAIEREALDLRRQCYAAYLARIDRGLLDRAISGDPAAARLAYQRFEGWEPGEKRKIDMNDELRVVAFRELLKALNEASPGFSDLFADQKDPAFITEVVEKEIPD